jgi:thiol-disulfide isomerase/thioredoxin
MKNRMKLIAGICGLILSTASTSQEITIHDHVPQMDSLRLLNHKDTFTALSEFNQKPLLLTFWNTKCGVGLQFLPKLDSLQKEYPSVQVLLVDHEPGEVVDAAFKNKKLLRHITLPVVVADTMLHKVFFPHRSEPHLVWIDKNGIVQAITGHMEATPRNMLLFSTGQRLSLTLKKEIMDPKIYFSITPLISNEYDKNKVKLLNYSYLGKYRPGIYNGATAAHYNPDEGTTTIKATNTSLYSLYKLAYVGLQTFHNSRIIATNISKEMTGNLYCYELVMKDTSEAHAYHCMRQDLDRTFGITSNIENRKIDVLVLKRTSAKDKLRSKALNGSQSDSYFTGDKYIIKYGWLGGILEYLVSSNKSPFHIMDETGYNNRVDMVMDVDFQDLEKVRNSLKKYGLDLVKEERELEVIILKKEQPR